MFFTIFILIVIYYFYKLFNKDEENPIFGIYTYPGKWYYLKYFIFYIFIKIRRVIAKIKVYCSRFMINENNLETLQADKEKPQLISDHYNSFDAVFFTGTNKDGFYLVVGCERRQMGISSCVVYLVMPGKGVLCNEEIPDTLHFNSGTNSFKTNNLEITPIIPMRKWKISYNGKMRYESNPAKIVHVSFCGEWENKWKHFDYDIDLNIHTIVRSIAKEKWSKEYFENLKRAHQHHYEQLGKMETNIKLDDEEFNISLDSFRDHSFGTNRNWKLMHRYVFHHIFCENGISFVVGVICQPCTASFIEVGYICLPGLKEPYPIEWCNFLLYQHGENGNPPNDYAFSFQANGKIYNVKVCNEYESEHYKGFNWEARLIDRFFKCSVNGIKGHGFAEFHYNNTSGRLEKYKNQDPEWYKNLHRE